MPQTVNTVLVTAPDATLSASGGGPVTLVAGQNTITISAPIVPAVHLTMPQTANTITVTAPAQSQIVQTFLQAGQNTLTLTAPEETLLAAVTLAAGQNTVVVSAPTATISAGFNIVMQAGTQMIVVTAPTVTLQPTWAGVLRQRHEARVALNTPHTGQVHLLAPEIADVSQVVFSTDTMIE